MTGIGNHNFDAQSHRQLYDKIHGGPGHRAAEAVDEAWNAFRAVMGNAKSELESAIRDSRAVWIGAAGERFAAGSAPLVQWAEDARVAGVETHRAFSAQTSFYGSAKDRMPEPVEVTSTANDDFWGIPAGFQHLVGGQTDQDLQEQAAHEAKREAVRVMNGYRDGAAAAVDLLGAFTPPPQVVTEVTEDRAGQYSDSVPVGTTTADRQQTPPPEIAPPAVVPQPDGSTPDGSTHTSTAQPPAEVAPKPTPSPVPAPSPAPTPPPNTVLPPVRKVTQRPPTGGFRRPPSPLSTPRTTGNGGIGNGKTPGGIPTPGTPRPAPLAPGQPAAGQIPAPPGADSTRLPRGAASAPAAGGVVGAPQRGPGDDDLEHKSPPYLEELADLWGEDDIPRVSPPVIGADD